jgi:rhodanese-related sulfurtransferase
MCRSGKRSAAAVMQLEAQGFTNLYNLYGGILAWQEDIDPSLDVY